MTNFENMNTKSHVPLNLFIYCLMNACDLCLYINKKFRKNSSTKSLDLGIIRVCSSATMKVLFNPVLTLCAMKRIPRKFQCLEHKNPPFSTCIVQLLKPRFIYLFILTSRLNIFIWSCSPRKQLLAHRYPPLLPLCFQSLNNSIDVALALLPYSKSHAKVSQQNLLNQFLEKRRF